MEGDVARLRAMRRPDPLSPAKSSTPQLPEGGCGYMITDNPKGDTRTYRGISYRKPIDEAKRLVSVPDLTEKLSGAPGVKRGRELVYICPLHDDHNPSLRVDRERGVWFCDPCLRGGDVVELYRLAQGYDQREAHTAA